MSRIPNRGEQQAVHPVLEKVPAMSEHDIQEITDFLYAHPQIAEAIEWVHDNVDPMFVPDGLGLFWRGFFDYEGEPRIPLSLTVTGPSPLWGVPLKGNWAEYDRVEEIYLKFLATLSEKFPDTDRLMRVYL